MRINSYVKYATGAVFGMISEYIHCHEANYYAIIALILIGSAILIELIFEK